LSLPKRLRYYLQHDRKALNCALRIEANDRRGLERLLRYCARRPFAAERIEELDRHRLIYHLPASQVRTGAPSS
jgi:hypothetical protein